MWDVGSANCSWLPQSLFLGGILVLALLLPTPAFAVTTVVYPVYTVNEFNPDIDSGHLARVISYPVQLLTLCLGKIGKDFELKPSALKDMSQARVLLQLKKGKEISIWWTMTSREREEALLPIRIPIDRGALGWRIFLIRKDVKLTFEKIKTLDDLKQFVAGQGHDWPDTEILTANGLRVVPSSGQRGNLTQMLMTNRFDYFPRSIIEAWGEVPLRQQSSKEIAVERTIALHYPAPTYFFVNKNNQKLAEQITQGCEKAIKDGSFQQLFNKFYGPYITRSDLKNRKVFHLQNPLLTPETPLNRKELWFSEEYR